MRHADSFRRQRRLLESLDEHTAPEDFRRRVSRVESQETVELDGVRTGDANVSRFLPPDIGESDVAK